MYPSRLPGRSASIATRPCRSSSAASVASRARDSRTSLMRSWAAWGVGVGGVGGEGGGRVRGMDAGGCQAARGDDRS
jgi:hypothetical protein